jgi:type VI secretion system protein ImpF
MIVLKNTSEPLLGRLFDHAPEKTHDEMKNPVSIDMIYEDIKVNLQRILNTRRPGFLSSHLSKCLQDSVMNYGISDFSSHYFSQRNTEKELAKDIEDAIIAFEPRLSGVKVDIDHSDLEVQREIFLRIEAVIQTKPKQDATYESRVNVMNQTFSFI